MPLRLSVSLWNEIAQWAEDDFRSMNGQIEYLLTECVKYRKNTGNRKNKILTGEERYAYYNNGNNTGKEI